MQAPAPEVQALVLVVRDKFRITGLSAGIRTDEKFLGDKKYAYIYRLNTKVRSTMLCLCGFEIYSRWVPLYSFPELK